MNGEVVEMGEEEKVRPLTEDELKKVSGGWEVPSEKCEIINAGKCLCGKGKLNPYSTSTSTLICDACGAIFFRKENGWETYNVFISGNEDDPFHFDPGY